MKGSRTSIIRTKHRESPGIFYLLSPIGLHYDSTLLRLSTVCHVVNCSLDEAFTTDNSSPTRAGIWSSYHHNSLRLRDVKLVPERLARRITSIFCILYSVGRQAGTQTNKGWDCSIIVPK